jgi:hypothetical protein
LLVWSSIAQGRGGDKRSHRKRGAAAAGGGGVGIVDDEARADQFLGEINRGPGEKGQGDGINDDLLPLAFENQVILRGLVEFDFVLKARAAAAFDGDAQGLSLIACTDFGGVSPWAAIASECS